MVVRIFGRDLDIQTPLARDVLDYWQRKKLGRLAPARREIDPAELRAALPQLMLLDVEAAAADSDLPFRFRIRLMGTGLCRHYGADHTGRYLDELDLAGQTAEVLGQCGAVMADPRPRHALGRIVEQGRHRSFERLLLPLSDDGDAVTAILGVQCDIVMDGAPAAR